MRHLALAGLTQRLHYSRREGYANDFAQGAQACFTVNENDYSILAILLKPFSGSKTEV